ncbi:MAG: GAF domain-containing protein, partial [Myxococcales bacterium]|nr:GAF domain-containing protein [Myxococcales bacterium]
ARTGEGLVLSDARADARTRHDANVARDRPTSVLCVPLEHKGVRSGLVYLENDRTADAFTPAHMQMQELLLGQAAVALENARLYGNLREALDRQVALTRAHHRFVPHQFLETLDRAGIEDVALGDSVHREMSILFSDMRGFTTHVEGMSSEESILFINRYLFYMEPEITRHRGFVDSYIGDAI